LRLVAAVSNLPEAIGGDEDIAVKPRKLTLLGARVTVETQVSKPHFEQDAWLTKTVFSSIVTA
jgi:hypothetical protein